MIALSCTEGLSSVQQAALVLSLEFSHLSKLKLGLSLKEGHQSDFHEEASSKASLSHTFRLGFPPQESGRAV